MRLEAEQFVRNLVYKIDAGEYVVHLHEWDVGLHFNKLTGGYLTKIEWRLGMDVMEIYVGPVNFSQMIRDEVISDPRTTEAYRVLEQCVRDIVKKKLQGMLDA